MIPQFEVLNQSEKELMFDAIPLITLLIAYADGKMDNEERTWPEKIADIRSSSHHETLQLYYAKVGDDFQEKLDQIRKILPEDNDQCLNEISNKLEGLNAVLPKLDQAFAFRYYDSLLSFAKHVARSSGGFLGLPAISKAERKLLGLDMIKAIELKVKSEDSFD